VSLQDLGSLDSSSSGKGQAAAAEGTTAAAAAAAGAGGESVLSGSQRHIAELLLEQIEVADVLLLNKADTVSSNQLQLLQVGGGSYADLADPVMSF
jgi:G3E family GTPase